MSLQCISQQQFQAFEILSLYSMSAGLLELSWSFAVFVTVSSMFFLLLFFLFLCVCVCVCVGVHVLSYDWTRAGSWNSPLIPLTPYWWRALGMQSKGNIDNDQQQQCVVLKMFAINSPSFIETPCIEHTHQISQTTISFLILSTVFSFFQFCHISVLWY